MALNDTKPLSSSKTFWGILISLIPIADQALEVTKVLPSGVLTEGAHVLIGAFGSLLALYGRIKATRQIS